APLVAWYGAVEVVPQNQVLAAMRAAEDPDGVRRKAIIEPADAAGLPPLAQPEMHEGALVSYEPDEIVVRVDAPREGIVVLNEIMFPGWHVEVDGKAATPLRANYLLRAVVVGPGTHTITWRFEPRRWRILVGSYLLALAVMLAAAVVPRRRRAPAAS
ncbi:MAG TPA: hypothetical protein VFV99_20575, partial [Kofleriaceae bacterium]|nr:hypothetical protein [Kofleriaceae bacterium]